MDESESMRDKANMALVYDVRSLDKTRDFLKKPKASKKK